MLGLTLAEGRQVLADFAVLSGLIEEPTYTTTIKTRLRTLVNRNLFGPTPSGGRKIKLNEVRNKLVRRSGSTTTIVPNGRADWVGWFELIRDRISGVELLNTGRVIDAVRPDILCLVEVEDRGSLARFNDQVLQNEFLAQFRHHLLVDGNDPRGIDIALLSNRPILGLRSYASTTRSSAATAPNSRSPCPTTSSSFSSATTSRVRATATRTATTPSGWISPGRR